MCDMSNQVGCQTPHLAALEEPWVVSIALSNVYPKPGPEMRDWDGTSCI